MTELEAMRIMKNAYMREWRRKNPEKVKANEAKYWAKKYQEMINKSMMEHSAEQGHGD